LAFFWCIAGHGISFATYGILVERCSAFGAFLRHSRAV